MNVHIVDLWIPILLGGVLAWVASALIHMLLKYHSSDYKALSNEDEVAAAIANGSPAVGLYSLPHCADMAAMQDEAMQRKFASGPVGFVTVFSVGLPPMGKLMVQQLSYFILGCAAVAYCAGLAMPAGSAYLEVFRFVGTVAFLTFGLAVLPYSIWYGHPWSTSAKYLLDAFIYGSVVAGTFAWLWPAA